MTTLPLNNFGTSAATFVKKAGSLISSTAIAVALISTAASGAPNIGNATPLSGFEGASVRLVDTLHSYRNLNQELAVVSEQEEDTTPTTGDGGDIEMLKEQLAGLPSMDDWDGYGTAAPNQQARDRAGAALDALVRMGFLPDKILPSAEDGVALTFYAGGRYADIEFFNDGDIAFLFNNFQETSRAWDISAEEVPQALEQIKEFINGHRETYSPVSSLQQHI